MNKKNDNQARKFICAECGRILPYDEIAAECDVCGTLFCKECHTNGALKEHIKEHE